MVLKNLYIITFTTFQSALCYEVQLFFLEKNKKNIQKLEMS